MAKLASKTISDMLHRERLSGLTPVLSPTEDNFFYCQNNKKQSYIGAVFMADTINGIDDSGFKLFVGALSTKLPADSIIQISEISTNHVDEALDVYLGQKLVQIDTNPHSTDKQKEGLRSTVRERVRGLRDAKRISPIQAADVTLRDNRLLFSVKVPADLKLSEYDLERSKELILSVFDGLKNSIFYSIRQLDKNEYMAQVRSILYPFDEYDNIYSEYQLVSEQMFNKTTVIDNSDPNFLKIDDTYFSVLSIKSLPEKNNIGLMNRIIGDAMGSHRQVSCPFLINCTIIIPDTETENNSIEFNYLQTQDTATPFAKKMSPKLRDRLHGLEVMFEQTKQGAVPCKLYFNVTLFHKDKNKVGRTASMLQNYYKNEHLELQPDSKIILPLFWNALPLYPSLESLKNTHRTLTMTIEHACTFAPIFSDFQNIKGSFSQVYYTRRGNIYGFDPMQGQNHNGMIFGSSGGGKSATTNFFIQQEIESGAMVRVIDEGKSYKKLCAVLGGTFIEFTHDKQYCLNPFTLVKNIAAELDQLTNIVVQMASPNTALNDYCINAIKKAITSAFSAGATKTTITDVAEFLDQQDDPEINRLGSQLYDYTERGQHGKYFNGDNNLDLDAQLIVLELEGLKQNEQLKTVVMMLLLTRIQTDMFFNKTYPRKFVFFEEVTSYLNKPIVAAYIADFYARLRKYGAGVWLVTQNIESVAMSESIGKILLNANYIIYLPYSRQQIDELVKKGYIENNDFVIESFRSLMLKKGQYSEALILENDTSNVSVVRIIFNEYESILYSSTGDYFAPFLNRLDKGEDVHKIIQSYIEEKRKNLSSLGAVNDRDIENAVKRFEGGEDIEKLLLEFKRNIINSTNRKG